MKVNVSIVEDDAQARELLAGWINQAKGFQCVSQHPHAEHALKNLPHIAPNVVLMDINLGGMTGVECVGKLKPIMPDTQFIMLTVYEDADHIFEALKAGATGYLLKQTERAGLLEAVLSVHTGGSPMTPNIARKLVRAFQNNSRPVPEVAELSARERQVLELMSQGYLYKEIADSLNIRQPTVATYIRRIYEKLQVTSRSEAIARMAHLPVKGDYQPAAAR
ncbi:MAG: response regulator transcription factor [Verrucomicrobiota bacterium]